jgi:hypothetical protein|nr:MAG TPA: hypothetical protein [Caudoviricetes sp.]
MLPKTFVSQSQLDQVIKNFWQRNNGKRTISICLGGGTGIKVCVSRTNVTAAVYVGSSRHKLGSYYSERLEADPDVSYRFPRAPFFTYSELLQKAASIRRKVLTEAPQATAEKQTSLALFPPPTSGGNKNRSELERRLKLIDLRIEREEILNQLAAM